MNGRELDGRRDKFTFLQCGSMDYATTFDGLFTIMIPGVGYGLNADFLVNGRIEYGWLPM